MTPVPPSFERRRTLRRLAIAPLPLVLSERASAEPRPTAWPSQRPTPPFRLDSHGQDGRAISLSSLRGTPVLLNFWASWCEPCRAEMPSLELLETRHRADGLRIIAINFRETDGAVNRFVEQTGLSLTVLRDRDGAVAQAYGVRVYPTTVAIDREGRARFSVIGEIDWLGRTAASWLPPLLGSQAT